MLRLIFFTNWLLLNNAKCSQICTNLKLSFSKRVGTLRLGFSLRIYTIYLIGATTFGDSQFLGVPYIRGTVNKAEESLYPLVP